MAWTYQVTNTGNVPLRWTVTDNVPGALACPRLLFISPGQTVFCFGRFGARAEPGLQRGDRNGGRQSSFTDPTVDDDDPANYFGVQGGIHLEKLTNDEDADEAPGPFISPGEDVTWTYRVTNTGNSDLTNVAGWS